MRKYLVGLGLFLVCGYIISTSFLEVRESEQAIITQFGSPVRVIADAGLVMKWPDPIESVVRIDNRLRSIDSDLGEYLTRDKKSLVMSAFILWRVADPLKFLQSVRDSAGAEQRLMDLASSELGGVVGGYQFEDFVTTKASDSNIDDIMRVVTDNSKLQARAEFGIEIVGIQLRRLGFPEQNLLAVHKRMRAERERLAKKYRAEGEEEAAKIRSQTDKEVRELMASTYREAQIKRGVGEAESTRIYAEAFSRDPEFYKLTRTLESYISILDDETTLILSSQSPLFRYLETPPGE